MGVGDFRSKRIASTLGPAAEWIDSIPKTVTSDTTRRRTGWRKTKCRSLSATPTARFGLALREGYRASIRNPMKAPGVCPSSSVG